MDKTRELIFEMSSRGVENIFLGHEEFNEAPLIEEKFLASEKADLPQVGELDIVRHYTNLSKLNFSIDANFYPLGSCTMKYNPKINEEIASFRGFVSLHPMLPETTVQGMLELLYTAGEYLKEISGLPGVSLLPAAGAHGELAGNFIFAKYFNDRNEIRTKMLIPDSAHGTNPASAIMAGFQPVEIPSDENGDIDLKALREAMDESVAGIMMTQPNTLGIFDSNFKKVAQIVHERGGLVYMDGANMNAMLCHVKPGEIGVDIMHFNLHKTFSTPHGMGGPGAGPICVSGELTEYLPVPVIGKDQSGTFHMEYNIPRSVGRMTEGYGNIGVILKALVYMMALGVQGLKDATDIAVLNANYVKVSLEKHYHLHFKGLCKHECVFDNSFQKDKGIRTLDIAKRLLDYGLHAPTVYFPLTVKEAIMVEPTETESKRSLDRFIQVMTKIAGECNDSPELLKNAPTKTPVRRLDETQAARNPILKWERGEQ